MHHDVAVPHPKKIIEAYGQLVKDKLGSPDWEGYMLSLMFNPLPGSPAITIRRMHQIARTFFSRLVTRIVNRPKRRNARKRTPIAIFFMDVPDGLKVMDIQDVLINGGVHMHGIVMVPKTSRLKESFDVHIEKNKTLYLIENEIRRIDVKPIKYASDHVTLYSGKAVVKRRFGYDDILVLC